MPHIDGLDDFGGEVYHTGQWPHDKVDFEKKTVVIIGTGSTGIQAIPKIAHQAEKLYVLQRTPNYSVPARNRPLSSDFHSAFIDEIDAWRSKMLGSRHGHPWTAPDRQVRKTAPAKRQKIMEEAWERGGLGFRESFDDVLLDEESNKIMSEFIRQKIMDTIDDPETAQKLLPMDHPFGTKRPPIDTNYFETFNRDHVHLIDVNESPISSCFTDGLILSDDTQIKADMIVFATGFDAMTGAVNAIEILNDEDLSLKSKWSDGPKTYLGMMVSNFPNLFMITGPQSPGVKSQMILSIEQHVDFIHNLIVHKKDNKYKKVNANSVNQDKWVNHNNEVANATLYPLAHSWYNGDNLSLIHI